MFFLPAIGVCFHNYFKHVEIYVVGKNTKITIPHDTFPLQKTLQLHTFAEPKMREIKYLYIIFSELSVRLQ